MTHLTLDQILELRDGASADGAWLEHLRLCAACAAELRRVTSLQSRLRELPTLQPASDRWSGIQGGVARRPRARAALATAVAAGVALALWLGVRPARAPGDEAEIGVLQAQSQLLEEQLRRVGEPEVMDLATAETLADVEDEIGVVDRCIADLRSAKARPRDVAGLWRIRIRLLESLLKLRSPSSALVRL